MWGIPISAAEKRKEERLRAISTAARSANRVRLNAFAQVIGDSIQSMPKELTKLIAEYLISGKGRSVGQVMQSQPDAILRTPMSLWPADELTAYLKGKEISGVSDLPIARYANVDMSGNYIEEVDAPFEGISIGDCVMNNNIISRVNCMLKGARIQNLRLSSNCISELPATAFVVAGMKASLKKLDLSDNFITRIEPGALNLPQLEELNLASNQLNEVPQDLCSLFSQPYARAEGPLPPYTLTFLRLNDNPLIKNAEEKSKYQALLDKIEQIMNSGRWAWRTY